ncbi:MAG: sporulation protein YqfD [Candidatus Caccovivens sp.]
MRIKEQTQFFIHSLNQEKILNELSKISPLSNINRISKNETSFSCSYFSYKKVEKFLKNKGVEITQIRHFGILGKLSKIYSSVGLLLAIVAFAVFYLVQCQFVWRYEVNGLDKLENMQVVSFVKEGFSNNKNKLNTKEVEIALLDNFDEISFVSCIVRGQTLVINIKEKLLPDEMNGDFAPIVAQKNGKISKIELVSGTVTVKVGDFVKEGDVLVEPYTIDTSGQIKKVEAKASIEAEVYNEGSVDHYECFIEVKRTGRVCQSNEITLFGLKIYSFSDENNFAMYECEYEDVDLVKNIMLPFKMRKTFIYELEEKTINSKFEDVADEYIAKAKEKALEKCQDCDTIKEEFYTLRHLSGVTIVNYVIVTQEKIGVYNAN